MGLAAASSIAPPSTTPFRSRRLIKRQFGWPRACDTLLKPGSLPTSRMLVLPDTLLVTRPPKASTIRFTLSLPRFSPAPPPTSGNTPVSTTVCPASELGWAAPRPGTGMTNAPPRASRLAPRGTTALPGDGLGLVASAPATAPLLLAPAAPVAASSSLGSVLGSTLGSDLVFVLGSAFGFVLGSALVSASAFALAVDSFLGVGA
mmetsp:Transcript_11001/g.28245  ORF Transcript_11001/g.28245 Transcript_11001/m.28245 type:complete len:204 (+) Transcript_11001:346-957(+)